MVESKSEPHLLSPVLSKYTSTFQFWLLPCLYRHWRHLCYHSNLIHTCLLNTCYKPNFVVIKENIQNSCLVTMVNKVGELAIFCTPIKLSLTIKFFSSRCLLPALILYLINLNKNQTLQNKYHSPPKKSLPDHTVVKLLKTKVKDNFEKLSEKKRHITFREAKQYI